MIKDELLLKYLQGTCSELELAEIHEWMKNAPENQQTLFRLEEVWQVGRTKLYSQERFLKKARQRLNKEIEQRQHTKQSKNIPLRSIMRYAAAIALLIGCLFTFKYFSHSRTEKSDQLLSLETTTKVRNFVLPDGTKIWLNKHSLLSYKKAFTSYEKREVTIVGQAYLEVAKDKKKQFIVHTELMDIKVQGTSFNVIAFRGSGKAETSLVEGSILVEGNNNEGSYVLSPGEKAEINRDLSVIEVTKTDAALSAVWREGLFPFTQANIYQIAESLEQYYDVKIFISPNVNLKNTYSGVLRQNDSIEDVLNSLKNTIQMSYKIKGGRIYIDKAGVY